MHCGIRVLPVTPRDELRDLGTERTVGADNIAHERRERTQREEGRPRESPEASAPGHGWRPRLAAASWGRPWQAAGSANIALLKRSHTHLVK